MSDSQKPAMVVLGAAVVITAVCALAVWRDFRSMSEVERARASATVKRLASMPNWSFVTVEEHASDGEPVPETYLVTMVEPAAAHLSGPGPGSRVFERHSRWISYANILRGPRARDHIIGVCAYGERCWEPLANWYFLQ